MSALVDLADWIESQLGYELASRQAIAETALARLRELAAAPILPTTAMPDGSATLSAADAATVLGALADGATWRQECAERFCPDCLLHQDGACPEHVADLDAADDYRALSARLDGPQ